MLHNKRHSLAGESSINGTSRVRSAQPVLHPSFAWVRRGVAHPILKIVSALGVMVLLITALSSVGSTVSYYSNQENSKDNKLQAGSLFLLLSEDGDVGGRLAATALLAGQDSEESLQDEENNVGS